MISVFPVRDAYYKITFSVENVGENNYTIVKSANGGSLESGTAIALMSMSDTDTTEHLCRSVVTVLTTDDGVRAAVEPVGIGTHSCINPVLIVEYLGLVPEILV
jgi:hypothetical protein